MGAHVLDTDTRAMRCTTQHHVASMHDECPHGKPTVVAVKQDMYSSCAVVVHTRTQQHGLEQADIVLAPPNRPCESMDTDGSTMDQTIEGMCSMKDMAGIVGAVGYAAVGCDWTGSRSGACTYVSQVGAL